MVSDCVEFTEDDLDNVRSRLYPNPTNDYLIFEAKTEELSSIEIYNYLGEEMNAFVSVQSTQANMLRLNVSELSSGIYFLKTKSDVLKFSKL